MANPYGVNQLGSDRVPYGQAKKMKQLSEEAPMSGAPIANAAVAAPQRARKRPQPQQEAPPPMVPEYQPTPQLPQSELFSAIASIKGASPLVQSIFGQSQPVPAAPLQQ